MKELCPRPEYILELLFQSDETRVNPSMQKKKYNAETKKILSEKQFYGSHIWGAVAHTYSRTTQQVRRVKAGWCESARRQR